MLFSVQAIVLMTLLGYFCWRNAYLRQRNSRTWESLMAQRQRYPGDCANPWACLQSARLTMEIADYAQRNRESSETILDGIQLSSVRQEAMELRIKSLLAIMGLCAPKAAS